MRKVLSLVVLSFVMVGCASQVEWAATEGSRSDGVVQLAYEHGSYIRPQADEQQAIELASQHCESWGYSSAEAFGRSTRQCSAHGSTGACDAWLVTKEYHCVD